MEKQIIKVLCICLVITASCVTRFIPETGTDPQLYVVEGMITDEQGAQTITISKSIPLGSEAKLNPVRYCDVYITDNTGKVYTLSEMAAGTYVTNPAFKGEAGRTYTLNININHLQMPGNKKILDYTLRSLPMLMQSVPKIDSLYYEKIQLSTEEGYPKNGQGCKILLNTSDKNSSCKYYRWDYKETWKMIAPVYQRTVHYICWITENSTDINVKAIGNLNENNINKHPIKLVSNESDRLSVRYRIEVNQYSINENEYNYWNNLEKISESTGNIYDRIPSSVTGNIFCPGRPEIQILGYFSVSAKTTKTLYVPGPFQGQVYPYSHCTENYVERTLEDTYWPPIGLFDYAGISYWIVEFAVDHYITTDDKGCIDCTVRGTSTMPSFWKDN